MAPGTQACQAAHAALDFAATYPELTGDWHAVSNILVILAVPDELSLGWLCRDGAHAGLRVVLVHEPDLGGALTAAAFEPAAWHLVRGLPLAMAGGARFIASPRAAGRAGRSSRPGPNSPSPVERR